ncbi:L-amino acid N-acyltransferase YncA [Ruminococcaceae bacterium YRB3002]|nr:L-amino acid N-acyltransferase YncA [Ruminococcaceae bacterium YRB3002]
MVIQRATADDLKEILELQYVAFESEAKILNNYKIPPMVQTMDSIREEFDKGIFLKAVDNDGTLVGSIRGYYEEDYVVIRKLFVRPDRRCHGIGTKLLYAMEKEFDTKRYVIFTSNKSVSNLALTETLGYRIFKKEPQDEVLTYVFLEKIVE